MWLLGFPTDIEIIFAIIHTSCYGKNQAKMPEYHGEVSTTPIVALTGRPQGYGRNLHNLIQPNLNLLISQLLCYHHQDHQPRTAEPHARPGSL